MLLYFLPLLLFLVFNNLFLFFHHFNLLDNLLFFLLLLLLHLLISFAFWAVCNFRNDFHFFFLFILYFLLLLSFWFICFVWLFVRLFSLLSYFFFVFLNLYLLFLVLLTLLLFIFFNFLFQSLFLSVFLLLFCFLLCSFLCFFLCSRYSFYWLNSICKFPQLCYKKSIHIVHMRVYTLWHLQTWMESLVLISHEAWVTNFKSWLNKLDKSVFQGIVDDPLILFNSNWACRIAKTKDITTRKWDTYTT